METTNNDDPQVILRRWRIKVLNVFLIIVAAVSAVGTVVSVSDAISYPDQWPIAIFFAILELVLIVFACFRQIDYRIRAWGVLVVPYFVGISNLATFGLGSSGRMFLLAVPIGGLILLGVRSGVIMSVFVAITMVVFTILAKNDLLQQWLVIDRNSLLLSDWFTESTDTLIILISILALLIMFYRFQEHTIARERHAKADLLEAQKMLEEQNITLEQKVDERTQELQISNLSLEQRNGELAIINKIQRSLASKLDFQAIIELFGNEIMRIFPPEQGDMRHYSVLIALYDYQTDLISFPYLMNGEGTHFHQPAMKLGSGLTSAVIQSGGPLVCKTRDEQIAFGMVEFLDEILKAKSQSWLGVPIRSADRVIGVFSVEDPRQDLFTEEDVQLLSTLASSLGVALENARLFDEIKLQEQQANEMQRRLADIINFLPDRNRSRRHAW
jgi:hypothetical protein